MSDAGVGSSGANDACERTVWREVMWLSGESRGRWTKSCVDGGIFVSKVGGRGRGKTRCIVRGGLGRDVAEG